MKSIVILGVVGSVVIAGCSSSESGRLDVSSFESSVTVNQSQLNAELDRGDNVGIHPPVNRSNDHHQGGVEQLNRQGVSLGELVTYWWEHPNELRHKARLNRDSASAEGFLRQDPGPDRRADDITPEARRFAHHLIISTGLPSSHPERISV
jgi:hypothetical protein